MRLNAQEYVTFVANHFRPIEAMCRARVRFDRDDEIVAFLRPFEDDDKNLSRLISRMREVGVLRELAGQWSPPPFLLNFIENLSKRHALASPQVIQGWIAGLRDLVEKFAKAIDAAHATMDERETEVIRFLIGEIADVLHTIVRTVEDNCERIASEVAEYRAIQDAQQLRDRLSRLVQLQRDYLEPVIRILDVNGDLFGVTQQVVNCCARLTVLAENVESDVGEKASHLNREVTWLRRVTIRRAEEARRELSPLCEAAARESRISKGVNSLLEQIRIRDWDSLQIESRMAIVDEKDGTFFSDLAVSRFLELATRVLPSPPPTIPQTTPTTMAAPLTSDELIEQLTKTEGVSDILEWVLQYDQQLSLDYALRLFHDVVGRSKEMARPVGVRANYEREQLSVNAMRWQWATNEMSSNSEVPE